MGIPRMDVILYIFNFYTTEVFHAYRYCKQAESPAEFLTGTLQILTPIVRLVCCGCADVVSDCTFTPDATRKSYTSYIIALAHLLCFNLEVFGFVSTMLVGCRFSLLIRVSHEACSKRSLSRQWA
jgi:hypothetical protein